MRRSEREEEEGGEAKPGARQEEEVGKTQGERGQTNERHCEVIVTAKLFDPPYSLTSARGAGELSRSPMKDSLRLIGRREERTEGGGGGVGVKGVTGDVD